MATIKYSSLLSEVLPYLAGDPSDPVTENAIKRAVIEFCAGSWIWKSIPDPIDIIAAENTYDLEAEAGSSIVALLSASVDGLPIKSKTVTWLNENMRFWNTTHETPSFFTQVNTDQIILARVPDSSITAGLTVQLALQPSIASTGFPAWISYLYVYAIADGALSKLMMMPNKPWTDIPNGMDRRNRFESAIANARANAVYALGSAEQRTEPQH